MRQAILIATTFLLVGLVMIPTGMAQSPSLPNAESSLTCEGGNYNIDYEKAAGIYNNNTDAIPDVIKPVIQSNTTELQIINGSQEYYTVETNDKWEITAVSLGQPSRKDVRVITDKDTACSLYTASDPVATFTEAYAAGEITIEPEGVVESAVTFVIDKVVKLFS